MATKKIDKDVEATRRMMEMGVRTNLVRMENKDKSLGIFLSFVILLSMGLIIAGGVTGSWTSIVAGTILLIFIGWSVKN